MTPLDEHGLVRLAAAEGTALVTFARRRLGDRPDEAEDAVQEALVKALQALRRGARPKDGRAWLFTIVARCCADARGSAARRRTVPVLVGHDIADAAPSIARTAEARAEVASAVRAIAALPEAQRQALVGYELGGDTYEELGERHGWSVSATKSLLWRARTRLAEERAGWAAVGGAPLTALRGLLGQADKPAGLLAAPWGAEALGCVTAAALGVAAVGLPASRAPAASASPPAVQHARPAPRGGGRAATSARLAGRRSVAQPLGEAPRVADPRAVAAACTAGEALPGRFTATALLRARRALPTDAAEYSGCSAAIDRALVRAG